MLRAAASAASPARCRRRERRLTAARCALRPASPSALQARFAVVSVHALAQKVEYIWYDGQEGQPIKVRLAGGGAQWVGRGGRYASSGAAACCSYLLQQRLAPRPPFATAPVC